MPVESACDTRDAELDLRPVEGDEADAELAALTKAIAHPVRVQIVRFLARQKACICGELVEMIPLAQSTVSQHLKVLKDAGLINGTIDGPRTNYCINPKCLRRLKVLMAGL